MCFSATASFGASIVLTTIGVLSLRKASNSAFIPFASIPLFFAVQQLMEGFVWLSLSNPTFAPLNASMTIGFLFFAQVVWPFWVPFSILKMEPFARQRRWEKILVAIGALVSLYLAYCLFTEPVTSQIDRHHIQYNQPYTESLSKLLLLPYFIVILVPPFFSRVKRMWMLGIMVVLSYVFTAIFFIDYTVSVWCFFASLMSISVLAVMHKHHQSGR